MIKIVTLTVLVATLLAVGCSESSDSPQRAEAGSPKPETVVVNEGMSEEEEDELKGRLAELEDRVNGGSAELPEQNTERVEDAARAAAQDYYAAAAAGDYGYTYSELSSYSRSQFSQDEWIAANTALGSDAARYNVYSVNMVDESLAEVYLTVTLPDGSSSERATRFVLENGDWKHDLTQVEYDLFAGATDGAASASASAPASASADANTKRVRIIISSNKPVDVSIYDDSLNWYVNEEIVGTEIYERDIRENSGLSVSTSTDAYRAQTTIKVYEDGSLVAQDTDPHGYAVVTY